MSFARIAAALDVYGGLTLRLQRWGGEKYVKDNLRRSCNATSLSTMHGRPCEFVTCTSFPMPTADEWVHYRRTLILLLVSLTEEVAQMVNEQ